MKTVVDKYITKNFIRLNTRDRRAVIILVVFIVLLILVFAILQPTRNIYVAAEDNYSNSILELSLVNSLENYSAVDNMVVMTTPNQSINDSAKNRGIIFSDIQQQDKIITIKIDNAPFNQIILWLGDIEKHYGISTNKVSINRNVTEGMVSADIILQI